jgi:crossover junction endodeoxyribonuclease RuvC
LITPGKSGKSIILRSYEGVKIYWGIDPGKKGGVSVLGEHGELLKICAFDGVEPYKVIETVNSHFKGFQSFVAVEGVHAMPGQGVTSMFTFGRGVGQIEGALGVLGILPMKIPPVIWQKLLTFKEGGDPKEAVKRYCFDKWGLQSFVFDRVPHQGCLDAAVIADYARMNAGEMEQEKPKVKKKKRGCIRL